MGLFQGRQRKEWRSALESARQAGAEGNVELAESSLRKALTLKSAVPDSWHQDFVELATALESEYEYTRRSLGATRPGRQRLPINDGLVFAALKSEVSVDPDVLETWRAALDAGQSSIDNTDPDAALWSIRTCLNLGDQIPWEMRAVDLPPIWTGLLSAAQRTADRGASMAALRVLQKSLAVAEALPPALITDLAATANKLAGNSPAGDGRRSYEEVFGAATRLAEDASDWSAPKQPPAVAPAAQPQARTSPLPSSRTSDPTAQQINDALATQRFAEASKLILAATERGLSESISIPAQTEELASLAPWGTVVNDLGLNEPPQRWDRSRAGKVRIRWASRLRWPRLTCVVITADGRSRLIVQDRSGEPEANLAEVPIELSGSLDDCVDWGKRILKDRRLYVALVDDVAAAWSPTSTPVRISEFLGGVALPALPVVDALSADSGPLQLPIRPGGYLGLANRLEELVRSGVPLDDSAKTVLGAFILKAPLSAGTWGPFKGIIKALEPRADEFPDALGTALARITCLSGADPLPADEALSVIAEGDIGGRKTLAYLDRRGRRVLRALSWRDPAAYAAVVTAFLGCVDSLLTDGNQIERRDALYFALYGAVRPVASHMRFPSPPPMPQRHQQRWDPAPEAWNRNSAEVSALLAHATTCSDIATWAFQVLTDLGAEIPLIHAEPALLSGNSDFQRLGFAAVAEDPSVVNQLSSEALATLIAHMPVDESAALLASSLPGDRLESAFEYLLVTPDKIPHLALSATEQKRVALLATQMASGPMPVQLSPAARVAVVRAALVLGESWDLTPVAVGLSLEQLADLREEVGDLPTTDTVRWLDEAIVRAADDSSWQTYSLADRWVGHSDPDLSRLGWRLADRYFGDDVLFLRLLQAPVASPAAVARCVSSLAASVSSSRTRVVLEWWAQTADQRQWEESVPAIDRALADNPQVWSNLWPLLSDKVDLSASQRLRQLPSLPQGMVESVTPAAIAALDERQTDALWSFLTAHPQRFGADDAFALAVTVVPNTVLCSAAISILRSQNRIKELWLPLIESGLPPAVAAGEQHLRSLNDKDTLRASMLDLLDSGNRDARTLAMTLLSDGDVDLSWTEVLDEMTEHRDPRIWREVADRLTDVGNVELLHAFERRVLTTRREGRAAKTLVQEHLTSARDSESAAAAVDVLLAMAQGDIPRDREWAVSQLLALAESGQSIPGLDVIDQAS